MPEVASASDAQLVDARDEAFRRAGWCYTLAVSHLGRNQTWMEEGDGDAARRKFVREIHANLIDCSFRCSVTVVVSRYQKQ